MPLSSSLCPYVIVVVVFRCRHRYFRGASATEEGSYRDGAGRSIGSGSSSLGSAGSRGSGSGASEAGRQEQRHDVFEEVATSASLEKYVQEWEQEARMRDGLGSAFEILNDNYSHFERRLMEGDNIVITIT